MPDETHSKMMDFLVTYPGKKINVSGYIGSVIDKHVPVVEID